MSAADRARRILCIEDEPHLREDLVLELSDEGYDVTVATDGTSARACLASAAFDLVLCDVQIPGVSGIDLLGEAPALFEGRRRPPFFILTAYSDDAVRRRCHELGAARLLVKPVDYGELLELIAEEFAA